MMRKILVLVIPICVIGCSKSNQYNATFYSNNQKVDTDGTFYITEKQSPYFFITDDKTNKIVSELVLDSIVFSINNKNYMARPIKLISSGRGIKSSDFLFPVDNHSGKIILDDFSGKKMFTLAANKTELVEIISPEKIIE